MKEEFETCKIKIRKGANPEEWAGADWWTKEDWDRFDAYVEELKKKGEYMKYEEYTVTYPKGAFDVFCNPKSDKPMFSNLKIFSPLNNKIYDKDY